MKKQIAGLFYCAVLFLQCEKINGKVYSPKVYNATVEGKAPYQRNIIDLNAQQSVRVNFDFEDDYGIDHYRVCLYQIHEEPLFIGRDHAPEDLRDCLYSAPLYKGRRNGQIVDWIFDLSQSAHNLRAENYHCVIIVINRFGFETEVHFPMKIKPLW